MFVISNCTEATVPEAEMTSLALDPLLVAFIPPIVANTPVVVALVAVRLVKNPVIPESKVENRELEVAAVMVVVAKVDVPCTDKVPVLVVEDRVLSLEVSLDIVAVASVVVAADNVLVALILPTIRLDPVAESKNREENVAVTAFNMEEKRLVEVAFTLLSSLMVAVDTERLDIVVVAKVDVPNTVKLPLAVDDPMPARNDTFSTQLDPFQYNVVLVAVPEANAPPLATLIHLVDVPVLDRT